MIVAAAVVCRFWESRCPSANARPTKQREQTEVNGIKRVENLLIFNGRPPRQGVRDEAVAGRQASLQNAANALIYNVRFRSSLKLRP